MNYDLIPARPRASPGHCTPRHLDRQCHRTGLRWLPLQQGTSSCYLPARRPTGGSPVLPPTTRDERDQIFQVGWRANVKPWWCRDRRSRRIQGRSNRPSGQQWQGWLWCFGGVGNYERYDGRWRSPAPALLPNQPAASTAPQLPKVAPRVHSSAKTPGLQTILLRKDFFVCINCIIMVTIQYISLRICTWSYPYIYRPIPISH